MKRRARFRCIKVAVYSQGELIQLSAVTDPDTPEPNQLMRAAPWGIMHMLVNNPAAIGVFFAGRDYEVTIREVKEKRAPDPDRQGAPVEG